MPDATGGFGHVPVLLDRCFELLHPALTRHHADGSGAVLIDGTVGAGGHAERFLTELPGLRLIGVDRDPTALDIVRTRLSRFADRLTLVQTRYDDIETALAESGYGSTESVDGMLFDLGVSSMQLDRAERGFSYAQDAPLDMRMDPTAPLTAAEILNTYDAAALSDILRRYGEEKLARRIATHIVRRRARVTVHLDRGAGRGDLPSSSGSGPPDRWTSREADVPGLAYCGQQRTGCVERHAACRAGRAGCRRTHRGDGIPVARRPHRQASVRRCDDLEQPVRTYRSNYPDTQRDSRC